MDKHHFKNAYSHLWKDADIKEREVKDLVENLLGVELTFYGLGAGTTGFINGSALDNGSVKGDADLYISEYDTFIEVTGPMIKVKPTDTLWVRPDKANNSISKLRSGIGKHHFVIHVANLRSGGVMYRAIKMGEHINDSISNGSIKTITPTIRGIREKYLEIPFLHSCVYGMDLFKNIITNGKRGQD